MIIFDTVIAKHANKKRGSASSHGAPLGTEELGYVKEQIGYQDYESFYVPEDILNTWREIGSRGDQEFCEWRDKLSNSNKKEEFLRRLNGITKDGLFEGIRDVKNSISLSNKAESTRKSNGAFIEKMISHMPELFGGSADLSESNCAINSHSKAIKSEFLSTVSPWLTLTDFITPSLGEVKTFSIFMASSTKS